MTMRYRPIPKRRLKPRSRPGPSFPAESILHKVKGVLNDHPDGVTLRQLAREANISWVTATKYAKFLAVRNETTTQVVGRAVLVRAIQRIEKA